VDCQKRATDMEFGRHQYQYLTTVSGTAEPLALLLGRVAEINEDVENCNRVERVDNSSNRWFGALLNFSVVVPTPGYNM
jgi:hypothetical protein